MFHKESVKIEVCKSIMEAYCRQKQESIRDPVVINGVMFLCRVLHDSVKYFITLINFYFIIFDVIHFSALTVEDEKRQISQLICGFVRSVDFGRDFEQQLSFYADARAAFCNLDYINVQLVQVRFQQ